MERNRKARKAQDAPYLVYFIWLARMLIQRPATGQGQLWPKYFIQSNSQQTFCSWLFCNVHLIMVDYTQHCTELEIWDLQNLLNFALVEQGQISFSLSFIWCCFKPANKLTKLPWLSIFGSKWALKEFWNIGSLGQIPPICARQPWFHFYKNFGVTLERFHQFMQDCLGFPYFFVCML